MLSRHNPIDIEAALRETPFTPPFPPASNRAAWTIPLGKLLMAACGSIQTSRLTSQWCTSRKKKYTLPEIVQRAIAYHTRAANLRDEWYIRPGTDAAFWGVDFAATHGPFISPAMFRKFCLPSIQERVRAVSRAA